MPSGKPSATGSMPSLNQKPATSRTSNLLTKSELESLRKEIQDAMKRARELAAMEK